MAHIGVQTGLIIAAVLFAAGLAGVIARRNIIFILLSIEIMLNACGLAFIVVGSSLGESDGQAMYFFILAAAAAEVAVGLGLILHMHRHLKTLDAGKLKRMRG
jgi:NADH-quinone oxidoreductase subunit K